MCFRYLRAGRNPVHFSRAALALLAAFLSLSSPVYAQVTSTTTPQAPPPETVTCTQNAYYGKVTDRSISHAHSVTLQLASDADGQYVYSTYVANWKDSGGGQALNATYGAARHVLLDETYGLDCPATLF